MPRGMITTQERYEWDNNEVVPPGFKIDDEGKLVMDEEAMEDLNMASGELLAEAQKVAVSDFAKTRTSAPMHPKVYLANVEFYRPKRLRTIPKWSTKHRAATEGRHKSEVWMAFAGENMSLRDEKPPMRGDELMRLLIWTALCPWLRWAPGTRWAGKVNVNGALFDWKGDGLTIYNSPIYDENTPEEEWPMDGPPVLRPSQYRKLVWEWGGIDVDDPPPPTELSMEEACDGGVEFAPFHKIAHGVPAPQNGVWPVLSVNMGLLPPLLLEKFCQRHRIPRYLGWHLDVELTDGMEVELEQYVYNLSRGNHPETVDVD